jgi:hypothetical protein
MLHIEDRPKLIKESCCEGEIAGFLPANGVLTKWKA